MPDDDNNPTDEPSPGPDEEMEVWAHNDPFEDFADEDLSFSIGGGQHTESLTYTGGRSILELADAFAESGNAERTVRGHLALLFVTGGIKTANMWNLHHPIHWKAPMVPYRYLSHVTLVGASGSDKGATVDLFFNIIRGDSTLDGPTSVWPTYEHKAGSLEALRGGWRQIGRNVEWSPGVLEQMDTGFIHIPEFSKLISAAHTSATGAVQDILAWADCGMMTVRTIQGGGDAKIYRSEATLLAGLQLARLDDLEESVLGWNRRAIYDHFPPKTIGQMLPENNPEPSGGDRHLLMELRTALRQLTLGWSPAAIDWSEFLTWLSQMYRDKKATSRDRQMLTSLAVGYHAVTGGAWTGNLRIIITPELDRILRKCLWFRGLSRLGPDRRGAHDTLEVLRDPYVMGGGQSVPEREVIRIVADRLSVPEGDVKGYLAVLQNPADGIPCIQILPNAVVPEGGRRTFFIRLADYYLQRA